MFNYIVSRIVLILYIFIRVNSIWNTYLFIYLFSFLPNCVYLIWRKALRIDTYHYQQLVETGVSISHLQGLYPEPNKPSSLCWYLLRSILILSSHLRQGFSKGIFPVVSPVKILKALLLSGYMTCPSQSSRLNHPGYISWTVQTFKFPIRWIAGLKSLSSNKGWP